VASVVLSASLIDTVATGLFILDIVYGLEGGDTERDISFGTKLFARIHPERGSLIGKEELRSVFVDGGVKD